MVGVDEGGLGIGVSARSEELHAVSKKIISRVSDSDNNFFILELIPFERIQGIL
jgi:hypothetical protein